MARPGFVYTVHKDTGLSHEFPEGSLESWVARGWEPADEPTEEEQSPPVANGDGGADSHQDTEVSPESPAPKKKTSKAAAAADKGEVTGG